MDDPYLATATIDKAHFRAILKSFDSRSAEIPVALLAQHVRTRPDLFYTLSSRKAEELVQSILKEHYDCEVRHVGRTSDGGIDLLLVLGDETSGIQVKRRTRPGTAEGVRLVREVLGAIQLQGLNSAMIATTADRFTKGAKEAANRAIARGLVRNFHLFDFRSLVDMLRLQEGRIPEPLRHFALEHWDDPSWLPPPEPVYAEPLVKAYYYPVVQLPRAIDSVVAIVTIDMDGRPTLQFCIHSQEDVPESVIATALERWRFTPPTINGRPATKADIAVLMWLRGSPASPNPPEPSNATPDAQRLL